MVPLRSLPGLGMTLGHFKKSSNLLHLRLRPITIRIGAPIPAPTSRARQTMEITSQHCAAVINGLLGGAPLPGSGPEQGP